MDLMASLCLISIKAELSRILPSAKSAVLDSTLKWNSESTRKDASLQEVQERQKMNVKVRCRCGRRLDDLMSMLAHSKICPFWKAEYHYLELLGKK